MTVKALIGLTLFFSFLANPSSSLTSSPPQLGNPTNNSEITSTKLEWQSPGYDLYPTKPFRVQVDDEESFSSPLTKDYYTDNTYYSPSLNPGIFYWRVKAKDISALWSDWSEVWKFTYLQKNQTATPNPTTSSTNTPSPTTSSQSSEENKFNVSEVPENISSSESFRVKIDLLLSKSHDSSFYLKGAFVKEGESNYFGLTKVGNTFIKNSSNFANQQKITTDSFGKWSGVLEVKADTEDSGFIGDGEYIFKVARYSSTGSGPTWSNQTNIYIKEVAKAKDEEESNSSQQISSTIPPQVLSATKSKATTSPKATSLKSSVLKNSTIAGIATYSGKDLMTVRPVEVKGQESPNFFLIGAGVIVLIAGAAIFVIFLKRH